MTTETFSEIGIYAPSIDKGPTDELDYTEDWTDYLALYSDSITSYSVTVSGVTLYAQARVGALITIWVRGGTLGTVANAAITIVTAGGRTVTRTMYFNIKTL